MKKYTIVDPATLRIAYPNSPWRDKLLSSEFHGRTFTKEEAGNFLSKEARRRGNGKATQEIVKILPFSWLLNRGMIIPIKI